MEINWKRARKAMEMLYQDRCNIYESQYIVNPTTKITEQVDDTLIIENAPCRVSFNSFPAATPTDSSNLISQSVKLFIAPDLDIKAGSKIEITRNGKTTTYTRSGEAAIYNTHQEIFLELWKGRA